MNQSPAASRLGRWRAAPALAITALLAFAGTADATIYRPADHTAFRTAVVNANGNPGRDTIILPNGRLLPELPVPAITDDLRITGDHSTQDLVPDTQPVIDGSFVVPLEADTFTIGLNVNVTMSGFLVVGASGPGGAVIRNSGHLRLDGMSLVGNSARVLDLIESSGSMTVHNTLISDNITDSVVISSIGPLSISSSSIVDNTANGHIDALDAFEIKNSIVARSQASDCFNPPTAPVITSLDSDGSCNATTVSDPGLGPVNPNGGPTPSRPPLPGSPALNAGSSAECPTTDQRFFVRPVGPCDIGAVETGAPRDITPPSCVVTAVRRPPATSTSQQDVTLRDGESGIGADGVYNEEVTITNGTVAFTPFMTALRNPATAPPPSNAGLVLTATKTTEGTATRWSFTARDWAGNTRLCQ